MPGPKTAGVLDCWRTNRGMPSHLISLPDVLFFLPKDVHAGQQNVIPGSYWHPPHSTVSPFERLLQGKESHLGTTLIGSTERRRLLKVGCLLDLLIVIECHAVIKLV